MASGLRQDTDVWYKKYEETKALANEILNSIQERNAKYPTGGPEASRITSKARSKIGALGASLEALRDLLESDECSSMTEVEKNVRRDMISTLRSSREASQRLLRRDTQAQSRAALLETSGPQASQPAQETVRTAGLDNSGLLTMQRQVMNDQDQELADLENSVRSSKHIALTINEELSLQERLLDDLNDDVDVTHSRMRAAQKKLNKVMQQSGNCKTLLVTIGLMVILAVVLVVCFKLTKLIFW